MLYWIIGTILLILIVLYFLVSFFAFSFFIDRSFPKNVIFKGKPSDSKKVHTVQYNMNYEEVFINSEDNLLLHAYLVKNEKSQKWVICVHGYSGNACNLFSQTKHFYENGFNVLAVDLRAHGKSQGKYCGLSYMDAKDIRLWCEWITKRNSDALISLMGISLGGASVLMASTLCLGENIRCVVSDSAPSDFTTQFAVVWNWFVKVPAALIFPGINMWMKMFAKFSLKDASPIMRVQNIKIPCLIIHGEEDRFVSSQMAYELYEKVTAKKKLLIVPGANHTQAINAQPELYWENIDNFLKENMVHPCSSCDLVEL